jgi:Zn-dependent M28 family amino/carboxypeptidase
MTYFQQVFPGQNATPETYTTNLKPDSEVVKLLPNYRVSLQKVMVPSDNVAAMVIGSDPLLRNEYITASAHLDHLGIRGDSIYNGADDNSSGCSLILEVAEAVALSRPKRSVLFILYTAEEFGLLGSEYFIKNSPVPVNDIKANLNFDMIGRPDGIAKELGTIGAEEPDPRLQQLIFSVNDNSAMLELDTTDYDNYFRRSDQYSFYAEGIPSVLFTTGEQPDYHTPDDDPEKINYEFLKEVSILAYEVIIELANE